MSFKKWIMDNIDFYKEIKTEEDLKIKALLPYLDELGYSSSDMQFERPKEIIIGSKKTIVFSDIEIVINDSVEIVIDTKAPNVTLDNKAVLQATSYSKLVSTPPALYAVATNGIDCITTNIFTGEVFDTIPTRSQLIRDLDKTKKRVFNEVEIREVKSVLFTLLEEDELYRVIKKSKDVIEKKGLIRSDQSFREMTKIILIKMNEERRVKASEGSNRFSSEYLIQNAKLNDTTEIAVFKMLFTEAIEKYPEIYTRTDEQILIDDNDCITSVVEYLEPFSFLGTGDDIKGAVYEIFLKSTLRGDFDQYFTPREIVEFMVEMADPNIGDIFIDPACGSGGFLIQAFNYVNNKIKISPFSEVEEKRKFKNLVEKSIWGHEADYDLHVLAKINLIMHGDGWNNIYQGDTLVSTKLKENFFDLVLTNPPFTIKYKFPNVLSKYELGIGKESEELDVLFVEKSLKLLEPGGDLFIVLPEGLLNNKAYKYFRTWLLEKSFLLCSISLPEGAFIPFGGSVSKTCILGVRKKDLQDLEKYKPNNVFLGKASEVGFELGKKDYRPVEKNDLRFFTTQSKEIFSTVRTSQYGGECGWINQSYINEYRLDGAYLLNHVDQVEMQKRFTNLVPLNKIVEISNNQVSILPGKKYLYLEVPDISEEMGLISNIRILDGKDINALRLRQFRSNDILFTRINPRKARFTVAPDLNRLIEEHGIYDSVMSPEIFRINLRKDNPYISLDRLFSVPLILKSSHVLNQIVRLATGSSSSRARVQEEDLLNDIFIPVPESDILELLHNNFKSAVESHWENSQSLLTSYIQSRELLGDANINKNDLRGI